MSQATKNRSKILVCDIPEAVERLRQVLEDEFTLVVSPSYDQALNLVKREHFDLVIAGMHFDESRMFELLGTIKMELKLINLPFLCFRHLHSRWSETVDQGIKLSAELMGACKFIDDAYQLSDAEIKAAIEECIAVGQQETAGVS